MYHPTEVVTEIETTDTETTGIDQGIEIVTDTEIEAEIEADTEMINTTNMTAIDRGVGIAAEIETETTGLIVVTEMIDIMTETTSIGMTETDTIPTEAEIEVKEVIENPGVTGTTTAETVTKIMIEVKGVIEVLGATRTEVMETVTGVPGGIHPGTVEKWRDPIPIIAGKVTRTTVIRHTGKTTTTTIHLQEEKIQLAATWMR